MSEVSLQVGVKIFFKQDEKYLFLRRTRKYKSKPQKWDIPGGRINSDETLEKALAREVLEETGLILERVDRLLIAQDIFVPGTNIHVVRLVYIGEASGEVVISNEHDDFRLLTKAQALAESHIDPYLRGVLGNL